jgi:hypothetical protein
MGHRNFGAIVIGRRLPASGQNGNKETEQMKRSTLVSSVAACFCLSLAAPLLAAEPGTVNQPSSSEKNVSAAKPAETCLSDLRAFYTQMEQDGYWLGGSPWGGYGIDYPMGSVGAVGYRNARPGYEVQILVAAATFSADTANSSRVRIRSPRPAISTKFT